MTPTPMSASRRLAAIVLLAGSLLLLLLVFALPAAMAYEVDENGQRVQRDADRPIEQAAPVDEPGINTALTDAQQKLYDANGQNNKAPEQGVRISRTVADRSLLKYDPNGDHQANGTVASSLLAPPVSPKTDQLVGTDGIVGSDDGDGDGDGKGDGKGDAPPKVELTDPRLVAAQAKIDARQDALQVKYDQRDQAVQDGLAKLDQAQANHPPAKLPGVSAEDQAADELAAAQTRARAWYAERNGQEGGTIALLAWQQALTEGGHVAQIIQQEKDSEAGVAEDIRQAHMMGQADLQTELEQQLSQYDPTNQSTRLWAALHAQQYVIPDAVKRAKEMYEAHLRAEQAAAALHPHDVAEELAGVVPAEERLFAYQTARDQAHDSLLAVGASADEVPLVNGKPIVDLSIARLLKERGQLPGWTEVTFDVHANLGQQGFPGEGTPVIARGYQTENGPNGQMVKALLPTGTGLLVEPATFANPGQNPQQTQTAPRFVIRTGDYDSANDARVVFYEPAPPDTALTPTAGDKLPKWMEGYLTDELHGVDARAAKATASRAAIQARIDQRLAKIRELQSEDNKLRHLGELGIHDHEIGVLNAQIARDQQIMAPVDAQVSAQLWQALQIKYENDARQKGGEEARLLQTLESRDPAVVAKDAQDPTSQLWKSRQEHGYLVPARVEQSIRQREAWHRIEVAAAAITPEIQADAALKLPAIDPSWADSGLRPLINRHNHAQALIQEYNAAVAAQAQQAQADQAAWQRFAAANAAMTPQVQADAARVLPATGSAYADAGLRDLITRREKALAVVQEYDAALKALRVTRQGGH